MYSFNENPLLRDSLQKHEPDTYWVLLLPLEEETCDMLPHAARSGVSSHALAGSADYLFITCEGERLMSASNSGVRDVQRRIDRV
mgnify:CR=1 FL=1